MGKYLPVQFDENDRYFVKSMGLEEDASLAHRNGSGKPYAVLHFVIGGEGMFCGNTVREDQGFFIECGDAFEYHSSTERPWNYFWIIFSDDLAKKYVSQVFCPDENGVFSYDFRPELSELCRRLFAYKSLGHEKALSIFFELLSLGRKKETVLHDKPHEHVSKAKYYIERNLHKRLSVSDVANAVHIDERYMYNLFMRCENRSPKEYIDRKKIELVCGILSDTEMSVSEAARQIGFSDVCSFSKFFSKKTGFSPTEYRKQSHK